MKSLQKQSRRIVLVLALIILLFSTAPSVFAAPLQAGAVGVHTYIIRGVAPQVRDGSNILVGTNEAFVATLTATATSPWPSTNRFENPTFSGKLTGTSLGTVEIGMGYPVSASYAYIGISSFQVMTRDHKAILA